MLNSSGPLRVKLYEYHGSDQTSISAIKDTVHKSLPYIRYSSDGDVP